MKVDKLFIGGCPRSGTTMLGAALGSHPNAVVTPESAFKTDAVRSLGFFPVSFRDRARILQTISESKDGIIWDVDPSKVYIQPTMAYGALLEAVFEQYCASRSLQMPLFWVDHTPKNIRESSLLLDMWPNAKFVHLVRDGRGVAASVMPLDWGPNNAFDAGRWWLAELSFGLALELMLGRDRCLRVHFEDYLQRPMYVLNEIAEWAGLGEMDSMSVMGDFQVPEYTKIQHSLVGHPPQADRAGAWRDSLSIREVSIFESVAGGMLNTLHYRPIYKLGSSPPSRRELARFRMESLIRSRLTNRLRRRYRRRRLNVTGNRRLSDG